jgi:hypothetical protein
MSSRHVVVDGSNIATEGRNLPNLAQLDQAVREFLGENPDDIITVVVDASFAHRIDASELATFEEAEAAGEVVSPPAGAIGRGDAFLLRIAEKTGATVLSNDSFQEFHGEHEWLFERGRLIGGKPVPGVGWIFTPRTPVRGIKSREAVKEAKRKKHEDVVETPASGLEVAASRGKGRGKKVDQAIATATEEVTETDEVKRKRRRGVRDTASEPINEPLAFITFIAAHPLGSEVIGTVDTFSSHGAYIEADGARCYLPLSAMGDPPPRSAREVVGKGESLSFVIQALDPLRRGVELALPGFARISSAPTEETIEAEIETGRGRDVDDEEEVAAPRPARRSRKKAAPPVAADDGTIGSPGVVDEPTASGRASAAASRLPRRNPARVAAASPSADSPAAASPAEAPPTPAPSPTPARRRTAKSSVPTVASAEDAGVPSEGPPQVDAPTKGSRRRRASTPPAVTAEDSASPPASLAAAAAPAPEVAAPRSGRRSKGAPANEPKPDQASGSTSASAKKRSPAKVPTAKETPVAKKAPAPKNVPVAKKVSVAKKAPAAVGADVAASKDSGGVSAPARKTAATKATAAKATAAKATAAKATTAKTAPAKKATAKRAPAKSVPAEATAVPAGTSRRSRQRSAASTAEEA